jgi:hypothetical protein
MEELDYRSGSVDTKGGKGAAVWSPRAVEITIAISFICLLSGSVTGFYLAKGLDSAQLEATQRSIEERDAEVSRLNGRIESMQVEHLKIAKIAMEREVKIEALTSELRLETAKLEEERRKSVVLAEKARSVQERLALAQAQVERLARAPRAFPLGGEVLPVGGVPPGDSLANFGEERATSWYKVLAFALALVLAAFTCGMFLGSKLRSHGIPRRR